MVSRTFSSGRNFARTELLVPRKNLREPMSASECNGDARKDNVRKDLAFAILIVTIGMVMPGVSLMMLTQGRLEIAQATSPQTSPVAPAGKQNRPAESKPGGTRPTTPAPEPARPDVDAPKAGTQPALPPAPAEKVAPPIKDPPIKEK
jgi:hypothetical protein